MRRAPSGSTELSQAGEGGGERDLIEACLVRACVVADEIVIGTVGTVGRTFRANERLKKEY